MTLGLWWMWQGQVAAQFVPLVSTCVCVAVAGSKLPMHWIPNQDPPPQPIFSTLFPFIRKGNLCTRVRVWYRQANL